MQFDDEEIPPLGDAEPLSSDVRGFAPEQMVRCVTCLRANPPTRTSCLYCAAQLPKTEANAALQKPELRKLEKWEQGFNVILFPNASTQLSEEVLKEVAQLLRLEQEGLERIVEINLPLPVARAATETSRIPQRIAVRMLDPPFPVTHALSAGPGQSHEHVRRCHAARPRRRLPLSCSPATSGRWP